MNKKIIVLGMLGIFLLASFVLVSSHSDEDFAAAKAIIDAKTPCQDLTETQLEMLGDYYMEQIHPGTAHEYMDQMMGGEGSESLTQMHIAMAYQFYCQETNGSNNYADYYSSMMGSGMMGNYGMMGNSYYQRNSFWGANWLLYVLVIAVLVLLIVLLGKKIQESNKKYRKRR